MEDIFVSSPVSSASASDSDAYNTESARLYFGPLKTPERKYSKNLFPPTQTISPRRSPRLSSPRTRSPSQTTDDNEDIDLVAQLINAPGGDEEHSSDSATPQAVDGAEDEPSSVLANRVMHAVDNPSPPPSPTLPLQSDIGYILPQPSNDETPVRRSPRPRISVTDLAPPLVVVSLPLSGARTQIKKKLTIDTCKPIDDSQDQEETVQQAQSQATPGAARQRSPTRSPMSFNRVLGSLSPKSTDLLSKLAFTSTEEHISLGDGVASSDSQTPFTFSMFPTLPESVTSHSTGPVRFSSPTRTTSPHKFRLRTPMPNDPMNTPARRIPIEQGIAQGHVSPQKAAQLGFKPDGLPLTSFYTPARRVLVPEHLATSVTRPGGIRFGSLLKGKERELSIEPIPRPVAARRDKEKTSGQPSTGELAKSSSMQSDRLPFPLVASNPALSTTPSTVPETCQDDLPPAKSVNIKSYLRQPTSRIPKFGTKPYTRSPVLKSREKDPSTLPKKTANLARKATVMESASTSQNASRSATSSISHAKPTVSTLTSLLKRKREVEKQSPVKPRIITLRQVPKVVLTSAASSKTRIEPPSVPNIKNTLQSSALRPSRVLDFESSKASHFMPQEQEAPTIVYNSQSVDTVMKSPETKESSLPPGSPMIQDLPNDVLEPQSKPESIVRDKLPSSDESSTFNLRRITRSRQSAVNEGSSRSLPTRRKLASSRSDDVFCGMSITALKDLTISNTARNQQYLIAKLETEVVRKEGVRPDSPAVKIPTIGQRQTEEKFKERAERAIRRARRSDGDVPSSDIEGSSDVGYSSPCEDHSGQGTLTKHRRGPGDEEDYETPERPDQDKSKLNVEADNQGGEPERRVKWDRGLFTTVYLDEVKLGTRQPLKENRSLKGILAPTAKALRLDTLGNLPQADLPLTDLVQENITIKKFVYDNDVVPVPELIVVKNTRSKSKKSKS